MSQYSVLLVDDEEEVFQVIIKKLDWEAIGFRIAGYAKNGVEALEMAEELQPDVVMTDIKMPYMDGLTLCRKLKDQYQQIKLIIFSGFDEFEYAKEAIKAEVEEYILKPINANELREVFVRIKTNLDKELDEKRNIDKLRSYYIESLPLLQENFYTSVLEGKIPSESIRTYALNYQIDLKGPYYLVTVLHISKTGMDTEAMNPLLLAVSVKKLTEEQLNGKWNSRTVVYLGDLIVISQLDEEDTRVYTDTMDKICKLALRVCNAKVTAGIGHLRSRVEDLSLSYQGAKSAVSYRVLYGTSRAINIAEIDPQETVDTPWEQPGIKKILKCVKMGDVEALRETEEEFIRELSARKMSPSRFQLLMIELLSELYRFGNENQISMEQIFGDRINMYQQLQQMESPDAVKRWLEDCCVKMQQQIQTDRQDTTKSFVARAVEYVQEHYGDKDLNIETICNYLNVSSAYFSTVFKKETGKTFIGYLTDLRMEQAVDLLITKQEKTYMIADKVGYTDPNYFSYVFKKQFGMSPSKYKAKVLGEA